MRHSVYRKLTIALLISIPLSFLTSILRVRDVLFEGAELSSNEALGECKRWLVGRYIFFVPKDVSHLFSSEIFVGGAHLSLSLPYTVVVKLKERKPIALLECTDGLCLLLDDGLVYKHPDIGAFEKITSLPKIRAKSLRKLKSGKRLHNSMWRKLKRVASALNRVGLNNVRWIDLDDAGGLKLRMDDGSIIQLGSYASLEDRLTIAAITYARLKEKIQQPIFIDARICGGCVYRIMQQRSRTMGN
jgi:hypothetical protein